MASIIIFGLVMLLVYLVMGGVEFGIEWVFFALISILLFAAGSFVLICSIVEIVHG